MPGNPKNYGLKIKSHEKTQAHLNASIAFGRWKAGQRIDRIQEQAIATEATFWRKSLLRIINIVMTLAMMSLALRGHREHVGDGDCYEGNFLALVAMQARFDPVLQDLLQTPARTAKYLSAMIQNELIDLISRTLCHRLITRIQACPFYTIIVDTTSDITRKDQVSLVIRWVSVVGEAAQINETFLTFLHTTDSKARGLADIVLAWLMDYGFDLAKIRGQGYDGASVMSGKVGGVQKLFCDIVNRHSNGVEVLVPLVHCAAHNLNLVINDAVEATVEGVSFFGTISEISNFFSRSLNQWAELALTEDGMKKLKLKKLCATRWASRIEAVRALQKCYSDILKVLACISLTMKDAKERADATGLRKNIENFDFVVCIIVWERMLTSLYRVSQKLPSTNTDLSVSVRLLSAAHGDMQYLHASWDDVLLTANAKSSAWGIRPELTEHRQRHKTRFHDNLLMDCRLADPTQAFKVNVFYKILDVAIGQLEWRFEGHKLVAGLFGFLFPPRPCWASPTPNWRLRRKACVRHFHLILVTTWCLRCDQSAESFMTSRQVVNR